MRYRVSPLWWPVLAAGSPLLGPLLLLRQRRFAANRARAERVNAERIAGAAPLSLPELDSLELTVLVEQQAAPGFESDPGVSYLLKSERGALLLDVGFGPQTTTLAHNAQRLGFSLDCVDALAISHLHLDHSGGLAATRAGRIGLPPEIGRPHEQPCFLPAPAQAVGFDAQVVTEPRLLAAGIGSSGPLARSLFFMGWCEEQALVARIKGKGLVVVTGCGHPTIGPILKMAGQLCDAPLYLLAGGLHFPISGSRLVSAGIQVQALLGTGFPPWRPINDDDLSAAIAAINAAGPKRVLLSGHDTCDHALARFGRELRAETAVLQAGNSYTL